MRAQPHLVHDMGWPEIHETSRSQAKMDAANSSQLNPPSSASQDKARTRAAVDENVDVEDEMEVRKSLRFCVINCTGLNLQHIGDEMYLSV